MNLTASNQVRAKTVLSHRYKPIIHHRVFTGRVDDIGTLKDVFCHMAICPDFRRLFRVVVNGEVYKYTAVPFSLASAHGCL